MSVTPVPPPLTSSLSSPTASLTSLGLKHVTCGPGVQVECTPSENDFNLKHELKLTRTSNNTQQSIGGTSPQKNIDDMIMNGARSINSCNRQQTTENVLMQTSDRPVPLVTAACVEEATGADADRLFVGTGSGELLQLFGRSAFSLKTGLQPVVGLAVLPDGVLLALEATGRLSALVVDRLAVPATAEGLNAQSELQEKCVSASVCCRPATS